MAECQTEAAGHTGGPRATVFSTSHLPGTTLAMLKCQIISLLSKNAHRLPHSSAMAKVLPGPMRLYVTSTLSPPDLPPSFHSSAYSPCLSSLLVASLTHQAQTPGPLHLLFCQIIICFPPFSIQMFTQMTPHQHKTATSIPPEPTLLCFSSLVYHDLTLQTCSSIRWFTVWNLRSTRIGAFVLAPCLGSNRTST